MSSAARPEHAVSQRSAAYRIQARTKRLHKADNKTFCTENFRGLDGFGIIGQVSIYCHLITSILTQLPQPEALASLAIRTASWLYVRRMYW